MDREQFDAALDEVEQTRIEVYRAGLPFGPGMDPVMRRNLFNGALEKNVAARDALWELVQSALSAPERAGGAEER